MGFVTDPARPIEPSRPAIEAYEDPAPFAATAQGHALQFFPGGDDRFKAMIDLIEAAQRTLKVAFYIYAPDESGRRFRDCLTAAARRGVQVELLIDGFGADAHKAFFRELIEAGGKFCCFIPHFGVRFLIRNHQKIVSADGEVAMLGGFNIEDSYFAAPCAEGWNDLAVTVRGPIVERVETWFDELWDWAVTPHARFRSMLRKLRRWHTGEGHVRLLIGGPTRGLSSWARCVSRDLVAAHKLDMVMAYFSPAPKLLKRIKRIARRGEARLVMAAKSDNGATIGASRALYKGLLRSKARVFEFQPTKLHTKLIVLDDRVYLGSANFDMRSLFVNLEIVLMIEDAALADTMREFIAGYLPWCEEITPELQQQRATLLTRARWWASWFLVSVVDYSVSRRLNLGL
jgi:cardiolipin synthase